MEQENEQKASFGLKLLSFLIPLAGLIIFACNISKKPKYAKGCGIAALIGFIITMMMAFLIPIGVGLLIYNSAQDVLEEGNVNISAQAIAVFNTMYESYEGERISGSRVKSLISMVKNNNLTNYEQTITVLADGVKMNSTGSNIIISNSKTYNVKMGYDSDGYINQIRITSNL